MSAPLACACLCCTVCSTCQMKYCSALHLLCFLFNTPTASLTVNLQVLSHHSGCLRMPYLSSLRTCIHKTLTARIPLSLGLLTVLDSATLQVIICSACSGHGFKLSPAIGSVLADMVLHDRCTEFEEQLRIHLLDRKRPGHAAVLDRFQQ